MLLKRFLTWALKIAAIGLLLSLLYFGYLYIRYNEDIPSGIAGAKADALATKMLESLNHEAFKQTNYLEWTSSSRRHYKWYKGSGYCEVKWKDFKVSLSLVSGKKSKAYIHNFEVINEQAEELISKAERLFNNDSFWLVAPYKVFDEGVIRKEVILDDGSSALLVTFTQGGTTPGDSYLWKLQESGRPESFKMYVSVIPIKGLEASWDSWIETSSGAWLPDEHKLLFLTLDMGNVKGTF